MPQRPPPPRLDGPPVEGVASAGPTGAIPSGPLADLIDEPLLGLDAGGALLAANRAARHLLEARDTLVLRAGRPHPLDDAMAARWSGALAEAAAGRRRLLRPSDPVARTVSLQPGSIAVPVVVRVGPDRGARLRTLWAWAHAVGLSARETRVVEAVVLEGESPEAIAEHDGVPIGSVRADLRAALDKAGVPGPRALAVELTRAAR